MNEEAQRKIERALKGMPRQEVPAHLWRQIQKATGEISLGERRASWPARLAEIYAQWSFGQRAFSSALAGLAVLVFAWGLLHDSAGRVSVIDLAIRPAETFPSYFRQYGHPATRPISDGTMVLAFNTLGNLP